MHDTSSSARSAQATLDARSFSLVLLDKRGVILSTNKAWHNAFPAHGDAWVAQGEGINYLSACEGDGSANASGLRAMAAGIRSVLCGAQPCFALEYRSGEHWLLGGVTRFEDKGEVRAIVTHVDISVRRARELQAIAELRFQNEEKGKRAAELAIANVELAFQNEEKGKRAAELAIANVELAFQNAEKGKRAAELLSARDEALSANLAKSNFLAHMSHEIRTPLNAIYGMANLIAKEPLSATQSARMDKLKTAFRHLSGTINDILDLSKIEANKLVLEEVPVQLDQMMANIATMVQGSTQDKGLALQVQVEAMPARLLGDPTRLAQALLNYAANAVKFTEVGSISLCASVQQDSAEATVVRFEVRDTGIGIAAERMPGLFQPFVQTEHSTARLYGGTGLGLVITRRLAEAMGGAAGAHSAAGQGSRFWFTARLRKGSALAGGPAVEAAECAAEVLRSSWAGRRILLVDDDAFNREIGLILLTDVGLEVDLAPDGQVAVAMAASKGYDLVLMDMRMPRLDGLQATRQIRTAAAGAAVPIVAMTANAFMEDRLQCLDAGMDDFVTKPIEPADLYRVVLQQLRRQGA